MRSNGTSVAKKKPMQAYETMKWSIAKKETSPLDRFSDQFTASQKNAAFLFPNAKPSCGNIN